MAQPSRPLSPFLHYRWQYTNTLSIVHRATGVILSGGFVLLVYWLMALAQGPVAFGRASSILSHPAFKALLTLVLLAFAYHLCNGIRHLLWDAGYGVGRREARRSGWVVIAATALIVILVGGVVFFGAGHQP